MLAAALQLAARACDLPNHFIEVVLSDRELSALVARVLQCVAVDLIRGRVAADRVRGGTYLADAVEDWGIVVVDGADRGLGREGV